MYRNNSARPKVDRKDYRNVRLITDDVSRPSVSISLFKMFYEAFLAGFWASVGSTLGKLSGTESTTGNSYLIWGILLIVMVVVNTWGCRHYLRSLDAASNSVAPTVISAASSYVLSGLIGIFLFEEGASFRWWSGALLIVLGLSLVARPRNKQKPE